MRKNQEAPRRIPTLCISNSIQDATCFKNYDVSLAEEATVRCQSPFRSKSCSDTSGKSARLLQESDITSSSEPELSESTPGAIQRSARDLTRIDLELLLNLVLSKTRPTTDASEQMQTSSQRRLQSLRRRHIIPPSALCSMRTVDHRSPATKRDARANLKLASRMERAPRSLSSKKDA